MITFTALSGGADASSPALSYILQVDDVTILLDCGAPGTEDYRKALRAVAPSIDLVLFSHGDIQHTGLYACAYARWNLKAQTYATLPVQATSRLAILEDAMTIRGEQDTPSPNKEDTDMDESNGPIGIADCLPTVDEIKEAYGTIQTVRYSQPTHLQGKCQGLTITPYNAGHTLGGAIWKIRSPSSGTIIYAVDINHLRERHLDGTILLKSGGGGIYEPLMRPDLLITDADRALLVSKRRKDRDALFLDTVTSTLRARGSVLLPCDPSTRVLELLVLLDQHWSFSRLKFPICLISHTNRDMLIFARSMMEWMGGTISKEDVGVEPGNRADQRTAPNADEEDALGALALRFRHLYQFTSSEALMDKFSSREPKLILAVPPTLAHGPSRQLFTQLAREPTNTIILTGKTTEGTLAHDIFTLWASHQPTPDSLHASEAGSVMVQVQSTFNVTLHSKVPLQGPELEEHLAQERAAKEKEAAQQAARARMEQDLLLEADGDVTSDSDTDSDDSDADDAMAVDQALGGTVPEPGGRKTRRRGDTGDAADWENPEQDDPMNGGKQLSFDIYLKGNVARTTSFFKTSSAQVQRFRMFPYVERKRRVDGYGETVDVGAWLRKGKALEEDQEANGGKNDKWQKGVAGKEAAPLKTEVEPPSKFVAESLDVKLNCKILFIDLEGLNDGRAVRTIIPQINPRKMVVIHSSKEASQAFIESCSSIRAMTKDILAPSENESIQIGQYTNSFSISLGQSLLSTVKLSRFEDNEIGYVHGRVTNEAGSVIPVLQMISGQDNSTDGTLAHRKGTVPGVAQPRVLPQSSMIGDLKLTALKSRLASLGIQAEFVGEGVLVCGGGSSLDSLEDAVAVRKTGKGRVALEGTVSDVYYTVRQEIYNLHATVAV